MPDLILPEHHICTRIPVKGKIAVAVRLCLNKRKRGAYILICQKSAHINSG